MYIYRPGMIGEAIRTKIENTRNSIRYGEENSQSFSEILASMMTVDTGTKVVGTANLVREGKSPAAYADGSTLLYAIQNAAGDTTAAKVVASLGLTQSDNSLKAAADSLTSSIKLLSSLNGTQDSSAVKQITDLVDKYNALLTDLRSGTTSSAFMYANILKTAAQTGADALAKAGISVSEDGRLTFDSEKFESVGLEGFLNSVSSAASAVSAYASSIKPSGTGVLDFLTESSDEDSGFISTSDYYNSLMNMYL